MLANGNVETGDYIPVKPQISLINNIASLCTQVFWVILCWIQLLRTLVPYNGVKVATEPHLDGGGGRFGQQFLDLIRRRIGPREHVFEFGCGPSFIGFSIIAHGFWKKLSLADMNPQAIDACIATIRLNNVTDACNAYVSDVYESISKTEQWDLIVGNLPHCGNRYL